MKKLYVFSLTMLFVFGTGMISIYGQVTSPAVDLVSIVGEAPPETATTSYVKSDCDTAPGLIITDDGSIENGYSGSPAVVSVVTFVEKFSITNPVQLAKVCLAFVTFADGDLDMEVVVFDDDGTDGEPGTELAALPVSLSGIPEATTAPYTLVWHDIDLMSLELTFGSGDVYIGARWEPETPNTFLAADESPGTPLVEGLVQMDTDGWVPIQNSFSNYRSMFIRPQIIPADIPPVPFANWALYTLIALILGFFMWRFQRMC